jgi:hypothetical protein
MADDLMAQLTLTEEQKKKKKEQEDLLKSLTGQLSPEDVASYSEEFVNIPSKQEALSKKYEASSERKDWAELADLIAQNVAKMGAAYQGQKSGTDLSKLDIKGYDWDKSRSRDLQKYSTELEPLQSREKNLAALIAAGSKAPAKEDKFALEEAMGVQEKGTGLPAYLVKGKTGYYNAFGKPVEVSKYAKEKQEKEEKDVGANVDESGFITTRKGSKVNRQYALPTGDIEDPSDLPRRSAGLITDSQKKYQAYKKENAINKADAQKGLQLLEKGTARYNDVLTYMFAKTNDSGGRLSDQDEIGRAHV